MSSPEDLNAAIARHQRLAHHLLRRRMPGLQDADADDLAQEVLLLAWRRASQMPTGSADRRVKAAIRLSLGPAISRHLRYTRRACRSAAKTVSIYESAGPDDHTIADGLAGTLDSARIEQVAEAAISNAEALVGPRKARIIKEWYGSQGTHDEIAKRLGYAHDSVVATAIAELRAAIQQLDLDQIDPTELRHQAPRRRRSSSRRGIKMGWRAKPVLQLHPESGDIIAQHESVCAAAAAIGVSNSMLCRAARGQKPSAGGFHWRFAA